MAPPFEDVVSVVHAGEVYLTKLGLQFILEEFDNTRGTMHGRASARRRTRTHVLYVLTPERALALDLLEQVNLRISYFLMK